MKSPGRLVG